jgi:hypothetical protein
MHFERQFPELPLRHSKAKNFSEPEAIPDEILDARGYRDLLDALLSFGLKVIDEFNVIRTRNGL